MELKNEALQSISHGNIDRIEISLRRWVWGKWLQSVGLSTSERIRYFLVLGEAVSWQKLLCATKARKLWRAMIIHIMQGHSTLFTYWSSSFHKDRLISWYVKIKRRTIATFFFFLPWVVLGPCVRGSFSKNIKKRKFIDLALILVLLYGFRNLNTFLRLHM